MPSSYILAPPSPSDFPELAAIQIAGFSADLRLTVLRNVSNVDYEDWGLRALRNPEVPSGTVAETMFARDKETGRIIGWGRWSVPDGDNKRPDGIEPMRNALPAGTDHALWDEIRTKAREIERAAVGDGQYIYLHVLVVHPEFQGRGAGRALLTACAQSADAKGLPVFVCGSPTGMRLYQSAGFKVVEEILDENGEVLTTGMVREPVTSGIQS